MRVVLSEDACGVYSLPPLVVAVVRTRLPLDAVKAIHWEIEALSGFRRRAPDDELTPTGLMIVMRNKSKPPGDEARDYINEWTRNDGHRVFAHGGLTVVIEQGGLWGSTMRVVARTIQIGNRASYPTDIFSNIPAALSFHAQYLTGLDADSIVAELDRLSAGAA